MLIPILRQFAMADFSLKEWGEAIPLSTDLWGWITPTPLHPLWGGDLVDALREIKLRALIPNGAEMAVGLRDINTVFVGWVSLGMALVGALAFGRRVRIWLWTALIFGLFTLGPFLQINGQYIFDLDGVKTAFPMPFALLHYIPIVKANRAPNRNSVVLMLALAVLVGYGVNWILGRFTIYDASTVLSTGLRFTKARVANWGIRSLGNVLVLGAAVLMVFEHLALPAPLSDARVPAVYEEIAADPNPVSVMHVPLGWRNSFGTWGPERTQLEYFQSVHGKPMLGGNISRAPDFKMDYFKRIPFFQALHDVQTMPQAEVSAELVEAARAQAAELMYLYNVGYVLLMPPIPERYPYVDHWQAAWDFAKDVLPLEAQPFGTGDGIEAYRVMQPEGGDQFRIDLGAPGTYPYRGEGWDVAEGEDIQGTRAVWATELRSRLFVPLRQVDAAADYTVQVQVHPFILPQSVALQINDTILESQPLAEGWQTLAWSVPGHALVNGLNRLELQWAQTAAPRLVNPGNRQIGGAGVELPVDAELKAFADGAFMALFDEAGEQHNASAGRRGVNVTLLDQAGAVVEQAGFDTTANAFESQKLAEFVGDLPDGQIALIASYGEAWAHLTPEAVQSLQHLGIALTLEQVQSHYFAAVGVAGAAPGSAALVLDGAEAFLRISLNNDRRTLAAAVDWVEVGR
ncbi:MAG: interleukin-like EMT inducer domain-containing protein [Caldilineaceae bacterium]